MINQSAIEAMINGVKAMQSGIMDTMKATYEKMGPEQSKIFIKALQDGGIEKLAKENAEKVIELNKQFLKK